MFDKTYRVKLSHSVEMLSLARKSILNADIYAVIEEIPQSLHALPNVLPQPNNNNCSKYLIGGLQWLLTELLCYVSAVGKEGNNKMDVDFLFARMSTSLLKAGSRSNSNLAIQFHCFVCLCACFLFFIVCFCFFI